MRPASRWRLPRYLLVDEPLLPVDGLVLLGLVLLGLLLEPEVLPPSEPLELLPAPVLLPLELLPCEVCSRMQSCFAVPVRSSHLLRSLELAPALLLGLLLVSLLLEPLLLLGLLLVSLLLEPLLLLGLLELGLLLEPVLLLGLVLLEPLLLGLLLILGLELELDPAVELSPAACTTAERLNSAAATAAPSNFMFIVSLLKGLREWNCAHRGAIAVPAVSEAAPRPDSRCPAQG